MASASRAWYENRLLGDANDDGQVQFEDFVTLADHFGRDDAVWEDGDFDGDGSVQFFDFRILANNFGQSRPQPIANSPLEVSEALSHNASAADELFEIEKLDDELTGLVDVR